MTTNAEMAEKCRRYAREFAHDRIAADLLRLAEEYDAADQIDHAAGQARISGGAGDGN